MRIYIAGPMTGYKEFNFPAFHKAANDLRLQGHEVFNPAEADIAEYGVDISKGNDTGCQEKAAKEHGFDLRKALADDLAYICLQADAIYMLKGWEYSKGANAEHATAKACLLTTSDAADEEAS